MVHNLTSIRLPAPIFSAMTDLLAVYAKSQEAFAFYEMFQKMTDDDWQTDMAFVPSEETLDAFAARTIEKARTDYEKAHFAFHCAADKLCATWIEIEITAVNRDRSSI